VAGCCFLACWLPFNLGVRPEAYVAFGVTSVLTLLWRGRGVWALALATLVAGVTVTASPASVLLAAPVLVLARRIVPLVRAGVSGRGELAARVAALCCVGAVSVALVFADQSLYSLVVATRWHDDFGPSVPWYDEISRYQYLLGTDQDGTATKRVPVLLTAVLLPVVALLLARRVEPDVTGTHPGAGMGPSAGRLAGVAFVGLLLLWLTPSKWSHYFGALAGVFTAFLVVAIAGLARVDRRAGERVDRVSGAIGLAGAAMVALVAGLAFSGPNAWWQPAVYDVPWAAGPIRPAGLPLDSPLLWLVVGAAGYLTVRARRNRAVARQALVAAPALLAVTVLGVSVALLLGSFVAGPIREPSGSLALSNVRRLAGAPSCGPGDDVAVLPDVPGSVMSPVGLDPGRAGGFAFGAGYDPAAPPPDPPGSGASVQLWGSLANGPANIGTLTTPWFALPRITEGQELTLSVAGRTDNGNSLSLEFGTAAGNGTVTSLTAVTPPDPLRSAPGQQPDHRLWRSIGVAATAVPSDADRVRIHAVDATSDPDGWLALTGPRLRQVHTLRDFLADHGPVLVAWPMAFLFPCAVDPVTVRDGLAEAPATVLEAPRRYASLSSVSTDRNSGGDFTPLRTLGGLGEVTTRLAGRPDTDWGTLLLTNYPAARDSYQVRVTRQEVSGLRGVSVAPVPPVNPAAGS
jgi:arabinosyltransferase B